MDVKILPLIFAVLMGGNMVFYLTHAHSPRRGAVPLSLPGCPRTFPKPTPPLLRVPEELQGPQDPPETPG